jgi:hypothetical protein
MVAAAALLARAAPHVKPERGRMALSLEDKLARLPGERRAKVDARAAEPIAKEMTLRDLRRARSHAGPSGSQARGQAGDPLAPGEAERPALHVAQLRRSHGRRVGPPGDVPRSTARTADDARPRACAGRSGCRKGTAGSPPTSPVRQKSPGRGSLRSGAALAQASARRSLSDAPPGHGPVAILVEAGRRPRGAAGTTVW